MTRYRVLVGEGKTPINYVIGYDRVKLQTDLVYRMKIKHRLRIKSIIFGELFHPYCEEMNFKLWPVEKLNQ